MKRKKSNQLKEGGTEKMPKRTINVTELHGPLEYEDEVEFLSECTINGDLKAPTVSTLAHLTVTGTLQCEELSHPPDVPPTCGKLYVGGDYKGGADEVSSPITPEPDVIQEEGVPDTDDPVLAEMLKEEERLKEEIGEPKEPVNVVAEKDKIRSVAVGDMVGLDKMRDAVLNKKIVATELGQTSDSIKHIQYFVLEDGTRIGIAFCRIDHAAGGVLKEFVSSDYVPGKYETMHVNDAVKLSEEDRKNLDVARFTIFSGRTNMSQ